MINLFVSEYILCIVPLGTKELKWQRFFRNKFNFFKKIILILKNCFVQFFSKINYVVLVIMI